MKIDLNCSVGTCPKKQTGSLGYCRAHYLRLWRYGDPEAPNPRVRPPVVRFMEKFVEVPNTCWLWTSALDYEGYGLFQSGTTDTDRAHRYAYTLFVGPIPAGLVLDHLCRNTSCVNPAHLEPVTTRENILRGTAPMAINARKTHCHRGHSFDEKNTYRPKSGGRICRACNRLAKKRYHARLKENAA